MKNRILQILVGLLGISLIGIILALLVYFLSPITSLPPAELSFLQPKHKQLEKSINALSFITNSEKPKFLPPFFLIFIAVCMILYFSLII